MEIRLNTTKHHRKPPSLLEDSETEVSADTISTGSPVISKSLSPRFNRPSQTLFVGCCIAIAALGAIGLCSQITFDQPTPHRQEFRAAGDSFTNGLDRQFVVPQPHPSDSAAQAGAVISHEPESTVEKEATPQPPQPLEPKAVPVVESPLPAARTAPPPAPVNLASSELDVLIAMIQYSEDNQTLKQIELRQRLSKCPAANTEVGISCRQHICEELPQPTTLCPAPNVTTPAKS